MAIANYCLLGERVSGTGLLGALLAKNVPGLKPVVFNHKHFFQDLDGLRRADTSKTLFLYVTREPIAWINSMCKTPYHAHGSLKNKSLGTFIRTEWHCVEDEASGVNQDSRTYGGEMLHERDPDTGHRFRNVLAMRAAKARHTLALGQQVEHFLHVRLHELQSDPQATLDGISREYELCRSEPFAPVETVRGKGRALYTPTRYAELSGADTEYVLREIDLDVEQALGYC